MGHGTWFVSGCLAGLRCRYDGEDKRQPQKLQTLIGRSPVLYECPEMLGGLPVPRIPAVIQKGDGYNVLDGTAKVVNAQGKDVTSAFISGAQKTLALLQQKGITHAVLKADSPSCAKTGIKRANGRKAVGCGVTAALLMRHGIEVEEI